MPKKSNSENSRTGTRSRGAAIPPEIHEHVRAVLGELNLGQDQLGRIASLLAKSVEETSTPAESFKRNLDQAAAEIELKQIKLTPRLATP